MNAFLAASSRITSRATALSSALSASPAARRVPRGGMQTAVVLAAGAIIVLVYGQQYTGSVFILSATYAIVTAGMAVQIGFSQQIAFSQSVFFGVGAYGVALLNTHFNMSVLLAAVIMVVGAALVALLLGSVVTRASGLALAVATLMLPLIAVGYVSGSGYLGGPVGAPLTGTLWPSSSASSAVVDGRRRPHRHRGARARRLHLRQDPLLRHRPRAVRARRRRADRRRPRGPHAAAEA